LASSSTDANAANVNLSGLTTDNDFSSPDGLWFARPQNPSGVGRPLLWIQTDDGAFTDRCNCMMLAALPGRVGDGAARTITNTNGTTATQATFVGAAATAGFLLARIIKAGVNASRVRSSMFSKVLKQFSSKPGSNTRAKVGEAPSTTVAWPALCSCDKR
jgi:secreted PhoX family phosphatase